MRYKRAMISEWELKPWGKGIISGKLQVLKPILMEQPLPLANLGKTLIL